MILNGPEGPTKFCPDCRISKSVANFTKNARSADRLSFYCAPCGRARLIESRRRRFGPPKTRSGQRPTDVPDGSKWCPECNATKLVTDFPRNRAQRSGIGTYCKPCHNRIVDANKEKHGGARNYHLRRRYGITVEHFDQMFEAQGGLCAICREAPAAHVDHDHATQLVRGLLCFNCNGALGQFRDRTDLMLRAIAYLGHGDRTSAADLPDLPSMHFGVYVGELAEPGPAQDPEDERPAA